LLFFLPADADIVRLLGNAKPLLSTLAAVPVQPQTAPLAS
jgi:hypothetical protein